MRSLGSLHGGGLVLVVAEALQAAVLVLATAQASELTSSRTSSTSSSSTGLAAPTIRVVGSSTVLPVAEAWQDLHPDSYEYIIDGGGSSSGARRVCAPHDDPDHAHIGGMSRDWRIDEAERLDDGNTFECLDSVSGIRSGRRITQSGIRSGQRITQLKVGTEALVFVVKKNGVAHNCLTDPDVGGLTIAQLRWIFSDWTDAELEASPYGNLDLSSVAPNDDGNGVKEWKDISSTCDKVPINPYGPGDQSGSYDFFARTVFMEAEGEGFHSCNMTQVRDLEQLTPSAAADELIANRRGSLGASNCYAPSEDDNLIKDWILADTGGIAVFSFAYFVQSSKTLTVGRLADDRVKGIADTDEAVITPDVYSIRDGSYSVFTRALYMNVDNRAWDLVRDYLTAGFSDDGQDAVTTLGYVPVNLAIRAKMQNQILEGANLAADYVPVPPSECMNGTELQATPYINPLGNLKENFTCTACEPGFFKWANTPTSCETCAAGTVAPELGRSECDACPSGQFAQSGGLSACSKCWNGTFAAYPGATHCEPCMPGQVQATPGSSECVSCLPGTYQPESARFECRACEPGQYAVAPGQTACSLCDPGYFQADPGADVPCRRCPRGNYTAEYGAVDCQACLPGLTTPYPGSYSMGQCVCGAGMYMPSSGSSSSSSSSEAEYPCLSCPVGMQCPIGSFERYLPHQLPQGFACAQDLLCNYPLLDHGYMSLEREPLKVYRCLSDDHCPGGAPAQCAHYRDSTKVACGSCQEEPRAYKRGEECELCSGPDIAPLIVAAVLFVGMLMAAAFALNRNVLTRSSATITVAVVIGLTVSCLQCLAVFSALKLNWFEPIKGLIRIFSVFGLDPSLIRLSCNVSAGAITNFLARQLLAPLSMVVIFLALVLKKKFVQREAALLPELLNTIGAVYSLIFISVVISAITPLICYDHPEDNGQSMVEYPSVLCYEDPEWFGLAACGLLSMLLVVTPFLSLCAYGTWCYTSWILSNKPACLTAYRFLFTRFKEERYYYGLILLLRSFLIPCIPALMRGKIAEQVLLVCFTLLVFLIVQMHLMPWRTRIINVYDATLAAWLVVVLICGIASSDFTAEKDSIENLSMGIFVATLLITIVALAKAAIDCCAPLNRFDDFICHHKDGAAAQARFLKILLMKMGKRKVFIDSDDLQQLDKLFDVVRRQTSRLIVYLSKDTLSRPWCCGEIVTAHVNGVAVARVVASDFDMPEAKGEDGWNLAPDFIDSDLFQYGISLEKVAEAYKWLMDGSLPEVSVKTHNHGRGRLQQVAAELLFKSSTPGTQRRNVDGCKDVVLVCSDPEDDEASATAGILVDKLGHQVLQDCAANGMFVMADVDSSEFEDNMDEQLLCLLKGAKGGIVVLTPYSMLCIIQLKVIVRALLTADIDLIPVATPQYNFPTEAYFTGVLPAVVQEVMPEDPGIVEDCLRAFFRNIAVHFSTHASNTVLSTQAKEIFKRMSDRRMSVSSSPTSTSTPTWRPSLRSDDSKALGKLRPINRIASSPATLSHSTCLASRPFSTTQEAKPRGTSSQRSSGVLGSVPIGRITSSPALLGHSHSLASRPCGSTQCWNWEAEKTRCRSKGGGWTIFLDDVGGDLEATGREHKGTATESVPSALGGDLEATGREHKGTATESVPSVLGHTALLSGSSLGKPIAAEKTRCRSKGGGWTIFLDDVGGDLQATRGEHKGIVAECVSPDTGSAARLISSSSGKPVVAEKASRHPIGSGSAMLVYDDTGDDEVAKSALSSLRHPKVVDVYHLEAEKASRHPIGSGSAMLVYDDTGSDEVAKSALSSVSHPKASDAYQLEVDRPGSSTSTLRADESEWTLLFAKTNVWEIAL